MIKLLQLLYVYEFQCEPSIIDRTLEVCQSIQWLENKNNFTSKDQKLLDNIAFSRIQEWIMSCIEEVNTAFAFEGVRITQSWVNLNPPSSFHHKHTHPNSLWSGVLFLTNSSSCLCFSMRNNWCSSGIIETEPVDERYREVVHQERSEKGKLLIFPSHLPHSVSENKDSYNRYTLSFNTFPFGRIGNYDRSNELIL